MPVLPNISDQYHLIDELRRDRTVLDNEVWVRETAQTLMDNLGSYQHGNYATQQVILPTHSARYYGPDTYMSPMTSYDTVIIELGPFLRDVPAEGKFICEMMLRMALENRRNEEEAASARQSEDRRDRINQRVSASGGTATDQVAGRLDRLRELAHSGTGDAGAPDRNEGDAQGD